MSTATNPFATNHAILLERLSHLQPPKAVRIFPGFSDFIAIKQYLAEVAEVVDDWAESVGFQVADNSPYSVDESDFRSVATCGLTDAVSACERIADRMRDDREAA